MEQNTHYIKGLRSMSWELDEPTDIHCPETARGCAYAHQMIENQRRRPRISSVHYSDFGASFAKKDWNTLTCKPRKEDGIWCKIKEAWEAGELRSIAAMNAITQALQLAHPDKYGFDSTIGEAEMKTMFKNAKFSWTRQEKLNAEHKLAIIDEHITAQNAYIEATEPGPSEDLLWNCIYEAKQAPKCIGNLAEVNIEEIHTAILKHAQNHDYHNWVESPTSSLPTRLWEPLTVRIDLDSRIGIVSEILFFGGGEDIAYWVSGYMFTTYPDPANVSSALVNFLLFVGPLLVLFRMWILGVRRRRREDRFLEVLEESEEESKTVLGGSTESISHSDGQMDSRIFWIALGRYS